LAGNEARGAGERASSAARSSAHGAPENFFAKIFAVWISETLFDDFGHAASTEERRLTHQAHEADQQQVETETVRARVLSIAELRERFGLPHAPPDSPPRPAPQYERPRIVRREAALLAS
jgi:hypothetical protein